MKDDSSDFFAHARKELPPVFALMELPRLLPVIKPKSVRNAIYLGYGPRCIRSGKTILLNREDFLEWLAARDNGGRA